MDWVLDNVIELLTLSVILFCLFFKKMHLQVKKTYIYKFNIGCMNQ